jgi:hypothetical protein
MRVRRKGNTLNAQARSDKALPMIARSDTSFWVDGYRAMMSFNSSATCPVTLIYRDHAYPRLDEQTSAQSSDFSAFAGEYESAELGARYRIEVKDTGLVMQHYRHGAIPLTRLWKDDFGGSAWFTRSVELEHGGSGRVIALFGLHR